MNRPKTVKVFYRGLPYELDLVACRRALVDCQVKGQMASMEELAGKVNISRSTASRFFSGRPTSLAVTLSILDALHLTFDDVAQPLDEDDEERTGKPAAPHRPRSTPPVGGAAAVHQPVEVQP